MKKKNVIFIILILLVLFISPLNVNAITYDYEQAKTKVSDLKSNGITTWPTKNLRVSDKGSAIYNAKDYVFTNFILEGSSKNYIAYSVDLSKSLPSTKEQVENINFSDIQNGPRNLSSEQIELLKYLLVSGYSQPTSTFNREYILKNKSDSLSILAMQFIVWEIVEGGRTSFSSIEPDYKADDSIYAALVYPNGADSTSSETLYGYYKKIIQDAYETQNPDSSPAFNNSDYQLEWDSVNNRYSLNVAGLGKYSDCVSDNEDVKIDKLDNGILISSKTEIDKTQITCSYGLGNYTGLPTNDENNRFTAFRFKTGCTNGSCSDLIYGGGYKLLSKSFNITTENTSIKIRKIGIDKEEIDGATFRLTNRSTSNYSIILIGNDKEESINKSGEYIVSEIIAPKGYEKISDFKIVVDSVNKKITGCDSSGKDSKGNLTCMNSQVYVTYEDNTIILNVIDVAKNFKIYSLDENNIPIKGVTYEIRNAKNEIVKFNLYDGNGNMFGYDKDGEVTDIMLSSTASYPIALLPEGEYKIIQKNAPSPYILSKNEENNTTLIKINNNGGLFVYDSDQKLYVSSSNNIVQVKNYKTKLGIVTTGSETPLRGVKYKLYNEDMSMEINSTLISEGIYSYDPNGGVDTYISNANGLITINYLNPGVYYLKEVETLPGYNIYEEPLKVVVDVNKNGNTINGSNSVDTFVVSNTPNSFTFYKTDVNGKAIKSGKFKIQKYDEALQKYIDIKLVQVDNTNNDVYTENEEDGKLQFTPSSGSATFTGMNEGKYRIIETVAPEGYIRANTTDTANVTVLENGLSAGQLVLKNKSLLTNDSGATAELIVNIQTGQTRVTYALIIIVCIGIIGLLLFLKKKNK